MERNLGKSLRLCRNVRKPCLQRHDQDQCQLLLGYFDIPSELAVEILRRLPIRSLLRFRCVSKSWKSFLDSSYFINSHLKRPLPATASDDDWLVAVIQAPFYHEMNVVRKDSFSLAHIFNPPEKHKKFTELSFIGSCNGIICVQALQGLIYDSRSCTKIVYLWNPARGLHRGESRIIDTRKFWGKSREPRVSLTDYGFGYDSCNNEYKVVKIQHQHRHNRGKSSKLCGYANRVYSLSTNSWRDIQSAPPSTSYPRPYSDDLSKGKPPLPLVNGATHWLADSQCSITYINNTQILQRAQGISGSVISFNFHDEVFGEISLPISSSTRGTTLVSYKSSLAVMVPDRDVICFEVTSFHLWVMKEYGVAESWTKLYTIDFPKFNDLVPQPLVLFRGFGEDENELVFSAYVQDPERADFTGRGVYFVKIDWSSSLQPTFAYSSARFLCSSEYQITFRPSLVSLSSDAGTGV